MYDASGNFNMIEIIPAILPKSFAELEEGLSRLRGVVPFVQIDFVGKNVLSEQESIPLWEEFDFEADVCCPNLRMKSVG
jgi:hypothetical protein